MSCTEFLHCNQFVMTRLPWTCMRACGVRHQEVRFRASLTPCTTLVSSLPPTSPHRRPILSTLSSNIPTSLAADLFKVAESTIHSSHRSNYDPMDTELYSKPKHGVKRKRLSDETKEGTHEFIKSRCPVKSGFTYYTRFYSIKTRC